MTEREFVSFQLFLRGRESSRERPVRSWRGGGRSDQQWISDLHRTWGWDVPGADLDIGLVMAEGDRFKAVALMEYKNAREQRASRFQRDVLCDLVRPGIPVYEVIADEKTRQFNPVPLNESAEKWLERWRSHAKEAA